MIFQGFLCIKYYKKNSVSPADVQSVYKYMFCIKNGIGRVDVRLKIGGRNVSR